MTSAKPTVDLSELESAVRANPDDAAPEYKFHELASAPRPIESPMPNGSFVERVVGGMIDHALGPAVPKAGDKASDVEP
jgi:hypothetical protein